VPLRAVRWPERTRHGARVADLEDGGALQCVDARAWDRWVESQGLGRAPIVRLQQSWRWALASVAALAALLVALWLHGVPWAARVLVVAIPASVDRALGDSALESLDERLLRPTALAPQTRARIEQAFERAAGALPPKEVPAHRLLFRQSRLGPNAFALPGGAIVLTDELVTLVDADPQILTGVLAHELGHLRHRHGMRLLIQATAIGALSTLVLGDFSGLLATLPVLLGQASYSRDAEREADAESVRVLRASGVSPLAMVAFFDKIAAWRSEAPQQEQRTGGAGRVGIAIASHPADAERMRFFREAAAR